MLKAIEVENFIVLSLQGFYINGICINSGRGRREFDFSNSFAPHQYENCYIDSWKYELSEADIQTCNQWAGPLLEKLGYPVLSEVGLS